MSAFAIAGDHPALPGHFPGRPVVPGVVVLDELAGIIATAWPGVSIAGFDTVKFRAPILPGQQVTVRLDRVGPASGAFACDVDGVVVAHGRVRLA